MKPTSTRSLFDDEPELQTPRTLVTVLAQTRPTDKAQLNFQKLVEKIERKREELRQWQECLSRYQQRIAGELEPLTAKLRVGQRQMATLIDELLTVPAPGKRLGKVQRAKLHQILMNLLAALLQEGDDAQMEALYDKHADVSHAQERQDDLEFTQAMLQDVFGVEVGDDHGASSAEELLRHAQEKMIERAAAEARLAEDRKAARAAKRKKSAAKPDNAVQARRDQQAEEASQSIREVYRKLASALHPDREPDAAERQRKTGLMQRVNDAYAAKDLLTLLGVQLEIEQIDASHLASVSPQRLAHFSQVLRDQLSELETEIAHCVMPFRMTLQVRDLTPALIDRHVEQDLRGLQLAIDELQSDIAAFRDPARLRASLASYPLAPDEDENDSDFLDLLQAFAPGPAPPSPARSRHTPAPAPKPRRRRR